MRRYRPTCAPMAARVLALLRSRRCACACMCVHARACACIVCVHARA
jgi:hypothetical protein